MRLFHSATFFAATYVFVVWNFARPITRLNNFYLLNLCVWMGMPRFGGGALSPNVITIWCRILISRSPRAFRSFKRRPCTKISIQDWYITFSNYVHYKVWKTLPTLSPTSRVSPLKFGRGYGIHPTLYWACGNSSILVLRLIHVNKGSGGTKTWSLYWPVLIRYTNRDYGMYE